MNPLPLYAHDRSSGRVVVYRDSDLEHLWSKLQCVQADVERTNATLNDICALLVQHVWAQVGDAACSESVTPVYLLRGGLFFLHAFRRISAHGTFGLVLPHRSEVGAPPKVIYADLPIGTDASVFLLMDLIVNTGATVTESLRTVHNLLKQSGSQAEEMHIIAPFVTAKAIDRIVRDFPATTIHTFWDNMTIGKDGRLVGLRFDGGDYACGGGRRVSFAD